MFSVLRLIHEPWLGPLGCSALEVEVETDQQEVEVEACVSSDVHFPVLDLSSA